MKHVDELIRGEMAAVQSIDQILNKIKDSVEREKLSTIRQDHVRAVDRLKSYSGPGFSSKIDSAGPWGTFAQAFTGGASFFGDKAALQALKIGEEHGLQEYKEALENGDINTELRTVIQSELLPNQEKHLSIINKYLQ